MIVRANDLMGVLLPVECAGCGAWDIALCERCHALLHAAPHRCEHLIPAWDGTDRLTPVWALGPYRGAMRSIILDWKSHRRTDLLPIMARACFEAGKALGAILNSAATLPTGLDQSGGEHPDDTMLEAVQDQVSDSAGVLVVPAPSGWRRRWQRRLVVGEMADAVAAGLARTLGEGTAVRSVDLLTRGRGGQAGRSARQRLAVSRSIAAKTTITTRWSAVVVDDVVTTGSTLAGGLDAVRAAGLLPVAGLTIAATPGPNRSKT